MLDAEIEVVEKYLMSGIYNEKVTPSWLRIKKSALESCQQSSEAPVQQLKAAIALVREAAHVHLTGLMEFHQFECGLKNIEQRAAI